MIVFPASILFFFLSFMYLGLFVSEALFFCCFCFPLSQPLYYILFVLCLPCVQRASSIKSKMKVRFSAVLVLARYAFSSHTSFFPLAFHSFAGCSYFVLVLVVFYFRFCLICFVVSCFSFFSLHCLQFISTYWGRLSTRKEVRRLLSVSYSSLLEKTFYHSHLLFRTVDCCLVGLNVSRYCFCTSSWHSFFWFPMFSPFLSRTVFWLCYRSQSWCIFVCSLLSLDSHDSQNWVAGRLRALRYDFFVISTKTAPLLQTL